MALTRAVVVLMALTSMTAVATPVAAGPFIDAYAGAAFTPREDASLSGTLSGATVDATFPGLKFEDSISGGLRFGFWFPFIGIGLDLSYFRPDISRQTVTATGTLNDPRGTLLDTPLTVSGTGPVAIPRDQYHVASGAVELMLRLPVLVDPTFPAGRLQPYVFAGPAVFASYLAGFDVDTTVGLKAGGGLALQILGPLAVFGEYQFTHFRPELTSSGVSIKLNVDTHHVVGGVSLRF